MHYFTDTDKYTDRHVVHVDLGLARTLTEFFLPFLFILDPDPHLDVNQDPGFQDVSNNTDPAILTQQF